MSTAPPPPPPPPPKLRVEQMSVLQLELVSPLLLESRGLSLAVPGTYRVDGKCVRIHKFLQNVQVRHQYSTLINQQ